jgi:hypothetical protein
MDINTDLHSLVIRHSGCDKTSCVPEGYCPQRWCPFDYRISDARRFVTRSLLAKMIAFVRSPK